MSAVEPKIHIVGIGSDGLAGLTARARELVTAADLLLGVGDPLIGRLLAYDSLEQSFRTFKVNRDPNCPACGPDAEIVIAEYDELCLPHAVLVDGTAVGH